MPAPGDSAEPAPKPPRKRRRAPTPPPDQDRSEGVVDREAGGLLSEARSIGVDVQSVEASAAREMGVVEREIEHESPLKLAIALLIAAVSVVGALVTFRAEIAGSAAAGFDRQGRAIAVAATSLKATSETQAEAEARIYLRFAAYRYRAQDLRKQVAAASPDIATRLARDVAVEEDLARSLCTGFNAEYVRGGSGLPGTGVACFNSVTTDFTEGTYDVQKRAADRTTAAVITNADNEVDSGRYFRLSDARSSHADFLLRLDLVLLVALVLFTFAQMARRRRRAIVLLVTGLAVFVATTALFVAVEVTG